MADDFAEEYEGKVEDFIEFILPGRFNCSGYF